MPAWIQQILTLVVPFVIGLITVPVWNAIEKLPVALDKLPSLVKPLAVSVVAWGIGLVAQLVQTPLPTDLHVWNADTVHSLLAAFFAFLLHEISKRSAPPAAAP